MITKHCYFTKDQVSFMEDYSNSTGLNQSEIVRQALDSYIRKRRKMSQEELNELKKQVKEQGDLIKQQQEEINKLKGKKEIVENAKRTWLND